MIRLDTFSTEQMSELWSTFDHTASNIKLSPLHF